MTPSPPLARRKSRSLAQELVDELAGSIRRGELTTGEKLPTETALVRERGVSRTVVREAISRLQAMGLVETRHGIGTFVLATTRSKGPLLDPDTLVTLTDVLDMLELRISVETEAAGLAAQRRSPEQVRNLRQVLDALEASLRQGGDSVADDFRFHQTIAAATGNRYFSDFMGHLGAAVIPRTRVDSAALADNRPADYLERVNREHEDIYNAIARQDSDAARAAMRTHLTNSRERLRRHIQQVEQTA